MSIKSILVSLVVALVAIYLSNKFQFVKNIVG